MIAVLTSSLGGAFRVDGKRVPSVLIEKNGLLDKVRSLWPEQARVLMIIHKCEIVEQQMMAQEAA